MILLIHVLTHELSELFVADERPLDDQDAPVDGPGPPEDVDRGQKLEEAHGELGLVGDVAFGHAGCEDRA